MNMKLELGSDQCSVSSMTDVERKRDKKREEERRGQTGRTGVQQGDLSTLTLKWETGPNRFLAKNFCR